MRGILFSLVFLCFVPVAAADEISQALECARLTADAARLECYDLIFKITVHSDQNVSLADGGQHTAWKVRKEISKLDDSTNVFIKVESIGTAPDRYGTPVKSWMMITCRENTTSLYISFANHFMSSLQGRGTVTYRIDKAPAKKLRFVESNDHSVLGLWNGGSSIPFIKQLFGKNTLLVRATPFSESSVTAEFPITGLEEVIAPLREACHW
jgi:type VI secretion system protein VasI